jgi:hypothetical protein
VWGVGVGVGVGGGGCRGGEEGLGMICTDRDSFTMVSLDLELIRELGLSIR